MAAIDKHELARLAALAPAGRVLAERRCPGCDYNLKGLPLDGKCPECGLPIQAPRGIDAPLSQMPRTVIVRFTRAAWLATLCVGALVLLVVSTHLLDLGLQIRVGFFVITLAWFGAVWELTPALDGPEAVSRGFSGRGRLRTAARTLQLGWVAAAAAYLLLRAIPPAKLTGSAPELLETARLASIAAGLAGIFCLGILLQRLAEWTRDGDAEGAFNLVVWGVPITTILMFFTPTILVLTIVLFLAWAVSVFAFPYALLSLSRSLMWSIRHSGEFHERTRRQRERAESYRDEIGKTVKRMDAAREQRRS